MSDTTSGKQRFQEKHDALQACRNDAEHARAEALSDEAREEKWSAVVRALETMTGKRRARNVRDKLLTYERAILAAADLRVDSLAVEQAEAAEREHVSLMYVNLMFPDRQGVRWEAWEDELLVGIAADGEDLDLRHALANLAGSLGRTPAAVSSRLSYLVGMRRMSQEVSGRLEGFLNGLPIDGTISGTLHRS